MSQYKISNCDLVDVSKIIPNPKNPNKHPEKQIKMLAKILDYQGQRLPIVVSNRTGFIVAGHGRLEAIKRLGWDKAAVSYQDFENEAQEYAHMIADNKIAELAEHDDNMMIDEIKDLGIDDFELLGLDDFELPLEIDPAKEEIEDDVPTDVETRCKPGDLWILGEHRLLCGDSTNIQHVERLMGGEKAQTFFTDPPYGDNVGGLRTKTGDERVKGKDLVKRVTFIANDKEIDWLEEVFNLVPAFLEETSTKMVFFKWDRFSQIKKMATVFGEPTALCVWDRVRKSLIYSAAPAQPSSPAKRQAGSAT